MGNNAAGYAIRMAAINLHRKGLLNWDSMDALCEPWRGCDEDDGGMTDSDGAEFHRALGDLYGIPFVTEDEAWDAWYDGAYRPWRKRYDFC